MSKNLHKLEPKHGFTLVELLVVISIISILAAIVFPVLAQAKKSAQKTSCASQLRQLGIALVLYASDNEDQACPAYRYNEDWTIEEAWDFCDGNKPGFLTSYTKTIALNKCPNFVGQTWSRTYSGYAYNTGYIGGEWAENRPAALLSQVTFPSETVLFADAGYGSPINGCNYLRAPSDSLFQAGTVDFRHNGTANVVFADTHLKSSHRKFNSPSWATSTGSISKGDELYDLD